LLFEECLFHSNKKTMRKNIILFILLLSIIATGWSQAQTIQMRIPDTTMVSGNTIDLPVYADSSLTNKNIVSYTLQLNYNQSYFQLISVIVTGTISNSFGTPTINTSVAGQITVAGAGTIPLTGKGKFIFVRLKALQTGNIGLSFSGSNYNYFNEGIPSMSFKTGTINITIPPAITVTPNNGIIIKGEQLQFSVTGGAAPLQWFVTNSSVATINTSGLLTGTQSGLTKVVVLDNNGLRDTTDNFIEIRALRLSISDTLKQWQNAYINVPVNTTSLTGLNITSGSFKLSVDTNLIKPVSVVQTGTILASYTTPTININTAGAITIGFAGDTPLSGSGTLLYVRYRVSAKNSGNTTIQISDILFNQDILASNTNGKFTTRNFAVISITPNTGSVVAGETQQLTISGGGLPPFTWSVNNTNVASINQSGLMAGIKSGIVKITVTDAVGATANSGNFQIYDTKITMPDTITCPAILPFYYPILTKSLPAGQSVYSLQATITYDTAYLSFMDIESAGTITQGWTYAKNPSVGKLIIAGSGTSAFNSAGTILKIKFTLRPKFVTASNAYVNLNDVTFNEGFPLPLVDINGKIIGAATVTAGTISGTTAVCQGQQSVAYSVPTISGATGYSWTLPTGATIATGSNTNSITVNYSNTAISGNIIVYGTNGCGNGTASPNFAVTVNTLPGATGTITGLTTVCQGQNAVTYTVPAAANATSYIWTLPTGGSGTSTTNSISVNYSTTAVSGNVVVKGKNSCGDGATSTLPIVVNIKPATPVITRSVNILHSDAPLGNQWYKNDSLITGATSQDFTVKLNGNYHVIVTINGCSSDLSNKLNVVSIGIESVLDNKLIKVYPNPVSNDLVIEIEGNRHEIGFEILNTSGQTVVKSKMVERTIVQTSNFSRGLYLVKLENGRTFEFKKIVKE
jgi:hypothetical protein